MIFFIFNDFVYTEGYGVGPHKDSQQSGKKGHTTCLPPTDPNIWGMMGVDGQVV